MYYREHGEYTGFYRASSMECLPIEEATMQQYKAIQIAG
jgi:predicted TIM-barrel enzyme